MKDTREILTFLGGCLPLFSALVWMLMIALSVHDSRTKLERWIKNTVLWYYILMSLVWISLLFYTYAPSLFIYINAPAFLAYMLSPVQLYRYICELSETGDLKPFSPWHYALPVLIVSVFGVWSFFIPWNVQAGLVESHGQISPEYPAYSRLFLSKPMMRSVYVLVYTVFSLLRLRCYYRTIGRQTDKYPKPARWIIGLMGLICITLLITAPSALLPREGIITSSLVLTIALLLVGEDFIIGYNMIRRNFLLYIPSVKERIYQMEAGTRRHGKVSPTPQNQEEIIESALYRVKLTKKKFEHYINSGNLWLDPGIKLTDLIAPLETSRTTLSNFVNKTYGVNFNRYINGLRLAELDRMLALPSNADKTADDLFYMAGFATKRNYTRAREAEHDNNPKQGGQQSAGKEVGK